MSIAAICISITAMLLLSTFFSGMEMAFTGSNKLKLEIDRRREGFSGHVAKVFTRDGGQYISAMLIGGNIVLVICSLLVSRLFAELTGSSSAALEILIASGALILAGEFIPRVSVMRNPGSYFRALLLPAYFFYLLLYPAARLINLMSEWITCLFGHGSKAEQTRRFSRAELVDLVGETDERDPEHEVRLLRNALDFPDLLVRDCMVQRIDIEAIELGSPMEELAHRFVESQYSRILVWKGSIDNIIGYVNIKSLFTLPVDMERIIMSVDYIPETMPARELMARFIRERSSIAVVIDEFGGTAGIISLEDILEEIFGEIEDEHDIPDLIEKHTGAGEYVFSCQLEVEYLNGKYGLGIEERDDYDTLAGYIIFNRGDIPPHGETMVIDRLEIKILRRSSSRIELARVRIIS